MTMRQRSQTFHGHSWSVQKRTAQFLKQHGSGLASLLALSLGPVATGLVNELRAVAREAETADLADRLERLRDLIDDQMSDPDLPPVDRFHQSAARWYCARLQELLSACAA